MQIKRPLQTVRGARAETATILAVLCSSASAVLFAAGAAAATDPIATNWGVPPYLDGPEVAGAVPITWARRLTGYIPARDGTALRYSVLLPEGKGPFPTVINYSGYDPGAIGGSAYRNGNTAMSPSIDRSLLEHGFAVLGVNARGTGCSEGRFNFLGPEYGLDGADVVEWAARQSWSTGAIGMANWSWAGMSQVATASERPPHLKAIAPGMAMTDPRADSWAIGGVPSQAFVTGWWQFLHSRWLAVRRSAVEERDARCSDQVDRNYEEGETRATNLPSQLERHPLRDAWIDDRTILRRAGGIDTPVLSMESFQDEATTARAGYYQELLDPERLWYVQTSGDHDLYESLQFRATLMGFFEHFLKGVDNGFERRPHVEIWQETTTNASPDLHSRHESAHARWIIRRRRAPVPIETRSLALASGHRLVDAPAGDGAPDEYAFPVPGPRVNATFGVSSWGPLPRDWRTGSVAYSTEPLAKDLVTYGPASADLWVSTNASDTDLQVTLTELRPDGQEVFVQRGWLRLSDRALDASRSSATLPILCDRPECIEAVRPDTPVLGRVELTKSSYAFRSGSRLRIWIDAPSATGGNDFDHSSLPATNRIWHDAEHPSKIVLGVLTGIDVPHPAAACGTVLSQPCRPDPLAAATP